MTALVIGGDAAGMSAAAGARRRRSVDELEIVAFERGRHTSFSACGIPYLVGDLVHDAEDLVARTPEEHRSNGIDVRMRHEVVAIDTAARTVTVRDLDAEPGAAEIVEPYDQLVIATGATPARPPLPGIDAAGVYGVQTLDDGIALRRARRRAVTRARGGGRAPGTSGSRWPRRCCAAGLSVTRDLRRRPRRCRRSTPTWATSSRTRCAGSASTCTWASAR